MKTPLLVFLVGFVVVSLINAELDPTLDDLESQAELEDNDSNEVNSDVPDESENVEKEELNENDLDENQLDPSEINESDQEDESYDADAKDGSDSTEMESSSSTSSSSKDARPWGRRRRRFFGGRRRRNIFTGRRRRFFTRRYWNRKFFPSCRRSSFSPGRNVLTRSRPLDSCIRSNTLGKQASCWAPKIYLAIGEQYRPSSVEFFFSNVKLVRYFKSGPLWLYRTVLNNPTASNMIPGNGNYYLKSKHRISSPSATVSFFKGQHPSQAPIYTFWREFKSGADTIRDFIYWAFYPYNRGKNVCIGAAKLGRCWGGCTIMGNHVGDWEHVTVRLKNNRPYQMYVGAHNFGGVYTWNGHTFVKGSDSIKYSHDGHPVIFSALGSHGHWTRANRHVYKKIKNGEQLIDRTSAGTAWDTWKKMELIRYEKGKHYGGKYKWLNFLGRWGDRKRGCVGLEKISGECRMNSGPIGVNLKKSMTSTNLSK